MNPSTPAVAPAAEPAEISLLDRQQAPAWQRLVEPLARLGTPGPEEAGQQHWRFVQAGWRHRSAPVVFYATKVALVLGLPLLTWALLSSLRQPPAGAMTAGVLLAAAIGGIWLPEALLRHRTAQRQREVFESLPDAIDLLVVCLESGLGLDAALDRVQRDLRMRSPVLADELDLLSSELRLGHARDRVLRHLALRTGVEEARLLVATLVQADRFGLAMAEALRVHAQDLRTRRQLRAEEAAAKIPVKLLFPLIFTLFPALMVVLLGPAIIGLMRQLLPLMGR